MTTPLILDSLEVRGFRAFSHLLIPRLGRVNLIVGKNNVGKTALLEALWLFATRGNPATIWQMLEARSEAKRLDRDAQGIKERAATIKHLFHGRKDIRQYVAPVVIGPVDSQMSLTIALGWYTEDGGRGHRFRETKPLSVEHFNPAANPLPGIAVRLGESTGVMYRLDVSPPLSFQEPIACTFVPAQGLNPTELERLWEGIALTSLETDVIGALRIIAPKVERVNLLSDSSGNLDERVPKAKIEDVDEPIPLRSLGEGMNRLFGVTLALVNSKNGLLLLDEVESGLHYSVQPDVWRLIFETAHRLNVQVFATTHSMDCIEAFQEAAAENEEEGVLIRLENENGLLVATEFDERRLGIATREEIEVR